MSLLGVFSDSFSIHMTDQISSTSPTKFQDAKLYHLAQGTEL